MDENGTTMGDEAWWAIGIQFFQAAFLRLLVGSTVVGEMINADGVFADGDAEVDAHDAEEGAVEGGAFFLGEERLDGTGGAAIELFLFGGPGVGVEGGGVEVHLLVVGGGGGGLDDFFDAGGAGIVVPI